MPFGFHIFLSYSCLSVYLDHANGAYKFCFINYLATFGRIGNYHGTYVGHSYLICHYPSPNFKSVGYVVNIASNS